MNADQRLYDYNELTAAQDKADRESEMVPYGDGASSATLTIKCDTSNGLMAETIWFPQYGLVKLSGGIYNRLYKVMSYESDLGIVEIKEGSVSLYRGVHRKN